MIHQPLIRFVLFGLLAVLLAGVVLPGWAAYQVPPYQGYVTDLAEVLSPEAEAKITQIAEELDQKTKAQIAVLTVPTLDGTPIETASLQTARTWGVGSKQAGNTGLLMLFAIQDRQLRTEVGYGIEGIITDGTAGQVRDEIFVPYFRQGDYETGILTGTAFYAQKIAQANGIELQSLTGEAAPDFSQRHAREEAPSLGGSVFLIFFGILFFVIILSALAGGRRRGGPFGGYWGGYGGGFGGGFGSGGGFGGFGGGGFGGGGASGRW